MSVRLLPFSRPDQPGVPRAHPVIVGHRGAPSVARENTPESFVAAWKAGAEWVELDVRRCADDTLAIHHDPVMSDGLAIVEVDKEGLSRRGVSTLDEVVNALPEGLGIDLEVKNLPGEPDYDEAQRTAGLVAARIMPLVRRRALMFSSFNPLTVQRLIADLPEVPSGLLTGPALRVDAAAELASELGASVLCPHVDAYPLDAAAFAAIHDSGLDIMVWVVDDVERARNLAAAGADALCTNEPARLAALPTRGQATTQQAPGAERSAR